MNEKLLKCLPGVLQTYKSIDTVGDPQEVFHYPGEFINTLKTYGLPRHALRLKMVAPIILLRNLELPALRNGTSLVFKNLLPHVVKATILTGYCMGENVFIPRIPLTLFSV